MALNLEQETGSLLRELGLTIAVAESATGGLISSSITDVPGSSDYFKGSVISYDNEIKSEVLGVSRETLEKYGAVSHQTAGEMALGVRKLMGADIGLSDTGIAGPGGSTPEKPVGLFYIGLSSELGAKVERHLFHGNRFENKQAATKAVLRLLQAYLSERTGQEMEVKHVVTCFLEHEGKIAIFKRSRQVGTYKERWSGISGYIEEGNSPSDQAFQEMREETGLDRKDVQLVTEGSPLEVVDMQMGRKWVVYPFRFKIMSPGKIVIDWENTEIRWIDPDNIDEYETVPKLSDTWKEVAGI